VNLPDGRHLAIYDYKGDRDSVPSSERWRNIELIAVDGSVVWQVQPHEMIGSPFVEAFVKDGKIELINFDGWAFSLNLHTGEIVPIEERR
jgi:hypothetical protein